MRSRNKSKTRRTTLSDSNASRASILHPDAKAILRQPAPRANDIHAAIIAEWHDFHARLAFDGALDHEDERLRKVGIRDKTLRQVAAGSRNDSVNADTALVSAASSPTRFNSSSKRLSEIKVPAASKAKVSPESPERATLQDFSEPGVGIDDEGERAARFADVVL